MLKAEVQDNWANREFKVLLQMNTGTGQAPARAALQHGETIPGLILPICTASPSHAIGFLVRICLPLELTLSIMRNCDPTPLNATANDYFSADPIRNVFRAPPHAIS
jgi:hypothetical protein